MGITRRKDGRWAKKITLSDGTVKFFYSKESTEKKAEKDIQIQLLNHTNKCFEKKHNFLSLAEQMLDSHESTVAYSTQQGYIHALKHLSPFYDENIEDISASMVQALLDDMAKQKFSYSAIQKTKTVFGMVLTYAMRNDIPLSDFRRALKIPRNTAKKKVKSPDDFIIEKVTQGATTIEWGMWAMCLLCFGYRRGELAAIQKKQIDFENDIVRYEQTVEFIHNQPHVKKTAKTESSENDMPLLAILKPLLFEYVKDMKPDDFIFGGKHPLSETQLNKRWKKYCKTIGCDFNMHQLRHAYAKLLYKAGVDVKTAQRLLRHADIRTTMNIYTDFADEVTLRSVDKINNYMSSTYS